MRSDEGLQVITADDSEVVNAPLDVLSEGCTVADEEVIDLCESKVIQTKTLVSPELKRILVSCTRVSSLLALLWVVFYSLSTLLPGIRPANQMIYNAKVDTLCSSIAFPDSARYKVLIFGNSRVLSGFKPDLFDSADKATFSYNLGLPDTEYFLSVLETVIERGQIPTHVFMTLGWSENKQEYSPAVLASERNNLVNTVFPFRNLPRDLTLFLIRSRYRGGVTEYYQLGIDSVAKMLKARGYYFIEGQSNYANHRLPEEFRQSQDTPDQTSCRYFDADHAIFKRLQQLHEEYAIQFYIVPSYYRCGAKAEPASVSENKKLLESCPFVHVAGPEYYRFGNQYFSDPVHLNREGAEVYTQKLRCLFEDECLNPSDSRDIVH